MEWQTSELRGRCPRILSELASDNVLAQPSVLRLLGAKFQVQTFYFQVYGNMVEETIMYHKLQTIRREKAGRMKIFRAKYPLHPKNCLLRHLWQTMSEVFNSTKKLSTIPSKGCSTKRWLITIEKTHLFRFLHFCLRQKPRFSAMTRGVNEKILLACFSF